MKLESKDPQAQLEPKTWAHAATIWDLCVGKRKRDSKTQMGLQVYNWSSYTMVKKSKKQEKVERARKKSI